MYYLSTLTRVFSPHNHTKGKFAGQKIAATQFLYYDVCSSRRKLSYPRWLKNECVGPVRVLLIFPFATRPSYNVCMYPVNVATVP